jgi:hypothetical protein
VNALVRNLLADYLDSDESLGGYLSRLEGLGDRYRTDIERIMEFLTLAMHPWPNETMVEECGQCGKVTIDIEYLQELLAVIAAWYIRAGEIAENPARLVGGSGNPFKGEREKAKAFIEKYDLPVSFRDALKHW